jgi:hypothetical protein
MSLSITAPRLDHARPTGLADFEYACLHYRHRVIGEYTAVTIHLAYAEPEGGAFTPRLIPLPLWDREMRPVDVLEQATLLLAAHGVVLLDEWSWWPEASAAWARIGHRGPLLYGPELVRRTEERATDIAIVASVLASGKGAPALAQDADHRLAGFYAWFREQVLAHGWPWRSADGHAVADAALQAALLHPDHDFQQQCVALLEALVDAGQEPDAHLHRLRAVAQARTEL